MTDEGAVDLGVPDPQPIRLPSEVDSLINAYADARVQREQVEDHAKGLRVAEEALEAQLFEWLESHNMRGVKHARGSFSLNDLAWASVVDEDLARSWAQREMPELLTLQRQRLSVVVREFLKGERAAMPAGIDYRTSRKITWRRQ